MVNNTSTTSTSPLLATVKGYAALCGVTLVALAALSAVAPDFATQDAWVHGIIVAGFALLLWARARAAASGDASAARAVRIIAAVLLIANVVEAAVPAFPDWMRIEMLAIAAIMARVVVLASRAKGALTTG